MAGAAGDAGCHMQDSVVEGGDLTASQLGVVDESDELSPHHQICCRQDEHGDVVNGGVGAGITGPQQPGQGFTAGNVRAVQKCQQRVTARANIPASG